MNTLKKLISIHSSANPEKISASLKGVVAFIAMLASFYGVTGLEASLNDLINSIPALLTGIGMVLSSLYAMFGIIRRIINVFKDK